MVFLKSNHKPNDQLKDLKYGVQRMLTIVLNWPTSAESIENYKSTVYPNPASDKVYINNLDGFQEYSILNLQGEVLKSGNLFSYMNQISLVRYPPGLYFMVLNNGNIRHSFKMVKR